MNIKLNINELKDALQYAYDTKESLLVLSQSGIGKSEAVAQFANQFPDGLIDLRLANYTSVDLSGLPVPNEDEKGVLRTSFALPTVFPTNPDWCGVILLDEIGQADSDVQSWAYQIVLERCINDYVLPEGAMVVAASNRMDDGGQTNAILSPLLNRFFVVEVEPDAECWINDYAVPNGVHAAVVSFVKSNPEKLFTFNDKSELDNEQFATARSWSKKVSALLYDIEAKGKGLGKVEKAMIGGAIGHELVGAFVHQYNAVSKLPPALSILDGKVKVFDYDGNLSMVFASSIACYSILSRASEDKNLDVDRFISQMNNFFAFFTEKQNVSTNSEISISFAKKLLTSIQKNNKNLYFSVIQNCDTLYEAVEEHAKIMSAA